MKECMGMVMHHRNAAIRPERRNVSRATSFPVAMMAKVEHPHPVAPGLAAGSLTICGIVAPRRRDGRAALQGVAQSRITGARGIAPSGTGLGLSLGPRGFYKKAPASGP
jgi:hypothetical protein